MNFPHPARMLARRLAACLLALPALLWSTSAAAQMRALSETELSQVSGQGLFTVSNTSLNGFDFTRISLDADVTLNANLTNVRLGEYNYAPHNGTGADIDIGAMRFGRSDGSADQRLVQITNPYFEFVYRDGATPGQREVVGMRLGFGSIAGDVGLQLNAVSGSILVNAGAAGTIDSNNDPNGGKRWDGNCPTCSVTLAQLGGVTAGDANGPSRDFWISVLKTPVQFPSAAGMPALTPAQAGVWMNWRDKLTALNLAGSIPPNLAAPVTH